MRFRVGQFAQITSSLEVTCQVARCQGQIEVSRWHADVQPQHGMLQAHRARAAALSRQLPASVRRSRLLPVSHHAALTLRPQPSCFGSGRPLTICTRRLEGVEARGIHLCQVKGGFVELLDVFPLNTPDDGVRTLITLAELLWTTDKSEP